MREVIYLAVGRRGARAMTKKLPALQRGEIPVKLLLEIEESAFREPVLERTVRITDWREGVDLSDLDLREGTITEEEAAMIREQRLARMAEALRGHGYSVDGPPDGGDRGKLDPVKPVGYSDTMPG
jgi:hypothetical protein